MHRTRERRVDRDDSSDDSSDSFYRGRKRYPRKRASRKIYVRGSSGDESSYDSYDPSDIETMRRHDRRNTRKIRVANRSRIRHTSIHSSRPWERGQNGRTTLASSDRTTIQTMANGIEQEHSSSKARCRRVTLSDPELCWNPHHG